MDVKLYEKKCTVSEATKAYALKKVTNWTGILRKMLKRQLFSGQRRKIAVLRSQCIPAVCISGRKKPQQI